MKQQVKQQSGVDDSMPSCNSGRGELYRHTHTVHNIQRCWSETVALMTAHDLREDACIPHAPVMRFAACCFQDLNAQSERRLEESLSVDMLQTEEYLSRNMQRSRTDLHSSDS